MNNPQADPLTEHEQMRALHHHGHFWLFERDGKPFVLYRRRYKKDGVLHLDCETGGLDHKRFSDISRKEFATAWNDHLTWKKAME